MWILNYYLTINSIYYVVIIYSIIFLLNKFLFDLAYILLYIFVVLLIIYPKKLHLYLFLYLNKIKMSTLSRGHERLLWVL